MKHIIVFHNDFDGVVSAALLLNFINQQYDFPQYSLIPVMYFGSDRTHNDMLKNIIESKFNKFAKDGNKVYVLDFPYHPIADIWIDHHKTNDLDSIPDAQKMFFRPFQRACAEIIPFFCIHENKEYRESIAESAAIGWASKIDSAGYKTKDEYYDCSSAWMQMRLFIEDGKKDQKSARIVELIVNHKFDANKVVDILGGVNGVVFKFKERINKTKGAIVVNGNIGLIITKNKNDYPRYSEFIVRPDIEYSIRVTNSNEENVKRISVGINPWIKFDRQMINIGGTLREIFGSRSGGHPTVGGAMCKEDDLQERLDVLFVKLRREE